MKSYQKDFSTFPKNVRNIFNISIRKDTAHRAAILPSMARDTTGPVESSSFCLLRATSATIHHSSWPHGILNPLNMAKDQTCIFLDTSQIYNPLSHNRNSYIKFYL